jgi:hypothetical protein
MPYLSFISLKSKIEIYLFIIMLSMIFLKKGNFLGKLINIYILKNHIEFFSYFNFKSNIF